MKKTSELSGFYKLDIATRRARAAEQAGLPARDLDVLASGAGLRDEQADHMVENALGVMGLPLGLCVNMLVDGRDHLVPMAVEEASVVAACSFASKLLRAGGGVTSQVDRPLMVGQLQVLEVGDLAAAEAALRSHAGELIAAANASNPALVNVGGGAVEIEVRRLEPLSADDPCGPMLVVHLVVDVRDAMGANAINTMCEVIAPRVAELCRGRVGLRILSNLADRRLVTVEGRVPFAALEGKGKDSGAGLARAIEEASVFAERDPYRAATHNKGIMNGIDAVLIALGQDWRAIEAGAHAFAAKGGRYTALARWRVEAEHLVGRMTLPMAVGTVGGIIQVHPSVKANRKLAAIGSTGELAALIAAAGLAQNLAALRALAAEGIQEGHMRLHARNIAIQAGASGEHIQIVADRIADQRTVSLEAAKSALAELAPAADAAPASTRESWRARRSTPPPPGAPEVCSADDRAFCETMLPLVSRTFALSIQALPPSLREAIAVSYLLCRIVDTVEDDRRQPPSVRGPLFDAFDAALDAAVVGDGTGGDAFERAAKDAGLGASENERRVVSGAGAAFRVFAALPPEQRDVIEPRVAEMSRGMRSYSERADREGGLRLRDLPDLEKYCYYVAGTVGELLTDLFALAYPVGEKQLREIEARAVSFGLGLQLVNILKDVAEDALRGDCFMPQKEAKDLGLDLAKIMQPSERAKGLALLREISGRARYHLENAETYTRLWPMPAAGQVRLFCAVPLALALATLREVEVGDDALLPNRAPTVSRALVMRVFEDALQASTAADPAEADRLLGALMDRSRTGVIGRPSRPTATLPSQPPIATTPDRSAADRRSSVPSAAAAGSSASGGAPLSSGDSRMEEQHSTQAQHAKPALQPRREMGGKLLVTGAAGHVGANLVHRLLLERRDVRVLVRPGSDNSAIDALEEVHGRKVERVSGDLRNLAEARAAVRGIDNVFHVAARVSTLSSSDLDLRDLYECNVIGTANLLRAAGEAGVKRTVVTGSLSAVGRDLDDPSKPSDETMPFYPFAEHLPYGRTKQLVEMETLKAVVEGVDAVIATSCAVLGPWDYKPSRMGRTLIDFANGKLRAYLPGGFDFVSTRDLSEGHILAMERGRSGQRYILSTQFVTVDELMDIFEEVSGRPRPALRLPATVMAGVAEVTTFFMSSFFPQKPQRFTPAAVRLLRMQRKADTGKAQVELGYKPTDVRSAIHEAYSHFVARGLVPQGRLGKSFSPLEDAAAVASPASKKSREGAAA